MRAWQVYHNGDILQLQWEPQQVTQPLESHSDLVPVQRLCAITPELVILLTADECLYSAHLDAKSKTLKLQLQRRGVHDVDYCAQMQQLYVVTSEGTVLTRMYRLRDSGLDSQDGTTLSFDPLELSEDGIRIKRVCCSQQGAIFVTHLNEIYVVGSCGEIFSADSAQPKHLRLFDEASIDDVIGMAAGDEFFVLLLRCAYDEKADPLDLFGRDDNKKLNSKATTITSSAPSSSTAQHQHTVAYALQSQSHNSTMFSAKRQSETPERESSQSNIAAIIDGSSVSQDLHSNSSLHSYSGSGSSTKNSHGSHEHEKYDVTHQLLRQGYGLLHTQVHTFGSTNNGLLGTGDHIKRTAISHIVKLDALGVCNIAAGREHTVARTLDGRLYHWGLNTKQQLQQPVPNGQTCTDSIDLSSPTEFEFGNRKDESSECSLEQRNILAACCGDFQTVLLNARNELHTNDGTAVSMTKESSKQNTKFIYHEKDFVALQLSSAASTKCQFPLLLASGAFTVHNRRQFRHQFHSCYAALQVQLKQMLKSNQTMRKLQMLQQKRGASAATFALKQLSPVCLGFRKLLCLVAAALKSLEAYYRADLESAADLLFIKHHRECIALFEAYTRANCNVYSVDGYTEATKVLANYSTLPLATRNGAIQVGEPRFIDFDLPSIFQQPLQAVPVFLQFLEQLSKTQHEYAEHLLAWQAYSRQNTIDLELAENTHDFWQRNERNAKIRHFRRLHRRVILTSSAVPLRLVQHAMISISSPTFILFSDCLCQLSGQLHTYPLVTMWLKIESDTVLRIITPERNLTLTARSHHDKMLWFDQLESSILAALGRPPGSKLSSLRTATYVFSGSHPKYAGVHAYGRWRNGVLHGNCYLEYPDGKFYYGEMRNGEIDGYGKMVIPAVGLYEGTFKAGKFHGHGTYEMKDNEVYEGCFRDGLFHGHGMLRSNYYTYVGEYQANLKCGYGVLDDMVTGDKYMGMFADNKRAGAGTCITMTGDYFEGIFVNDELAGNGIAVFENDYYYEGELCMRGPNGKGAYYMPNAVAQSEDSGINDNDDNSERILSGNIISGQLSGVWQEVRVVSGSVAINRNFSRYPKSIGDLVVDNERKWCTLFDNFEEQIFGSTTTASRTVSTDVVTNATTPAAAATTGAAKLYWSRIAIFMTTQREREKALEQQDTMHESTRHSYFGRNISMGFGSRSFDRLSLKSSNSLLTEPFVDDFRGGRNRYIKTAASPKRSLSQETLYDSSLELNDPDYYSHSHAHQQQQQNDELHSLSGFSMSQLASWANDTMSGIAGSVSGHDGDGTATPSMRSSYDSVFNLTSSFNNNSYSSTCGSLNTLEYVPSFGIATLNENDIIAIKEYLIQAFKDRHHPLYLLNQRIANCFYISYGCWKVKPTPILAKQAMHEWESISRHVYRFVRKLFPALPEDFCVIESTREVISHITLLYPIVLTEGIYSTLFVLYANKYSRKDELYRQNLIYAEKLTDGELATLLGLECTLLDVVGTSLYAEAIQTLKQLQEKYSPKAMLTVIEQCMQLITDAHKMVENANSVILAADSMMPLTLFLVLRAAVPHLGAELALLDDLTGGANFQFEMNGIAGYCYTTLKAAYEHITAKPLHNKLT